MEGKKLDIIRKYLANQFSGCAVEEKYDFDRCAQTFKIHVGRESLLLKVGENFFGDNDEKKIVDCLEEWKVANILRENKGLGIFVGNGGLKTFNRI